MANKGRMTRGELDYIRSKYGIISVSQIARNLGRSRTIVSRIVNREGLRDKAKDAAGGGGKTAPNRPGDAPLDALGRLKELRDILRDSLRGATPKETAALAREYRATVEAIERMEGDPTDDAAIALDAVASSIARRMPS